MKTRTLLLALLAIVSLAVGSAAFAASHERIPGTGVSLVIPPNFEITTDFAGIVWADGGSSIHIAELPVAWTELRDSMTAESMATKGMVLQKSRNVEVELGPAALYHVTQTAQGMEFEKFILLGGSSTRAVMLTATFPSAVAGDVAEILVRCLESARWDSDRVADPLEGRGWVVAETRDLRFSNAMPGGPLMLTLGGAVKMASPEDPIMFVMSATGEDASGDVVVASKLLLAKMRDLSNPQLLEAQHLSIAGMPAYEIIAYAKTNESVEVVVYQVVAFDGSRYFMMQGRAGADVYERYLDQFREVARSFSLKP